MGGSGRSIFSLGGRGGSGRDDKQSVCTTARDVLRAVEESGASWFWKTDRQGNITYMTDSVANEIARQKHSVIGASFTDIFEIDEESPDNERTLVFHLTSRTSFTDFSVRLSGGEEDRWWTITGRPVLDGFGQFQGFAGSGSDLTEKRRAEAEITRLAMYDALTGLANRQRIHLNLKQMLSSRSSSHRNTALLILDLDRFKSVNDTLGHQTGDALLKQVAQRLTQSIGSKGVVGRQGGDEFKVVLPGEGNPDRIAQLSEQIIDALSQPYFINGSSISIGCSIGAAIAPDDGDDSETLERNADLALYAAKGAGRGVVRFFEPQLLAGAQNRKQLEDDLRLALGRDELHLVYQPVVSTKDVQIVGFEVLLRWDHPMRGPISPAEFIPIAEDCGLIEDLGTWVLRTATREAATWPGHVRVAVNVSPIQFANPALPGIVTHAIAQSGISPARLELEITEGVFLNESDASERMFKSLKGIGVRLALDDFGTGYSSLGYLRTAPFDKIKIDQSFVRGAAQPGNRNSAIIKAIVTLADTLGMETTAEGVEIQDEIDLIRELGCSHIQGYVYGRPVRCEKVREQLGEGKDVKASGYRVSRSPRASVIRWAQLRVGDDEGPIRIRNLSPYGAMIDGIEFPKSAIGATLKLEIIEGVWEDAELRWAKDGQAGVRFARMFNMSLLNAPAKAGAKIRRVG